MAMLDKSENFQRQRIAFARQDTLRVSDDSGAKTLSDVSIITEGDALGHGVYIDAITISQAKDLLGSKKLKSYITHNGAWADRLTQEVGSFSGFFVSGSQLKASTFRPFKSFSKNRPEAHDMLFELAEEMPEDFGVSIVADGYAVWVTEEGEEIPYRYGDEKPDKAKYDKPSLRVTAIFSADFVDAPAANAGGLFRAQNDNHKSNHTMSETNDKELLALNKQVSSLKDQVVDLKEQLSAKDSELEGAKNAHQIELKSERERIREILELGKEHGQEKLAFDAIGEGTAIKEFQTQLLAAYAKGNKPGQSGEESDINPDRAPKSLEEFIATYRQLSKTTPRKAGEYSVKYADKFNK